MGFAESSVSQAPRTRVLILNAHATEREGLAALLARQDGVELVGVTGSPEDAAEAIQSASPEVVVVDLATPQEGGIEMLRRLLQHPQHPRVVAIRRDYSRDQIAAAFEAGVSACVSTNAGVSDLMSAVQAAQAGRTFLCPFVTRVLIEQPAVQPVTVPPGGRQLTRREQEVLELIAAGSTDRQIAAQLTLAVGTVHTHRKHIMAKLGVRNVTSLLRRARELGLLSPG
jgi:DNA-binding NarL/FixJ family response regulator